MDPNISALFFGSMALSFKAQADSQALLHMQLAYGLQMDNRLLTGALMNELFTGSDPSKAMDYGLASVTPTGTHAGGASTAGKAA